MLRVWGRANSSNVMKLVWLLELLEVPYQRIDVGGPFGGTDTPAYLAMNPNQRVPTLEEEDGFILWESNATLRYLASTLPGGEALWPADMRARANVDRWMDWQQCTVDAPQRVLLQGLVRTPPERRDLAALEKAAAELRHWWTLLDRQLARGSFVAGGAFSLADIALGVHVHRWFAYEIEKPELPTLKAWYERLLSTPVYERHVALPVK
ncbi:glutathione S-transferase family protein [Aquabacter sp. CN5-332]|uniref:glutathione S-transferase family protein n=1 Tax=Aquabacter sp. CN5-332 TaxID=3156608 RepID=UPI0032B460F1